MQGRSSFTNPPPPPPHTGAMTAPSNMNTHDAGSIGSYSIDDLERRYDRLITEINDHISRLELLEADLANQLVRSGMSGVSDTVTESTSDTLDDMSIDDINRALGIVPDRRVSFDDNIYNIDRLDDDYEDMPHLSPMTVVRDYTPFEFIVHSDSDSDTDTLVEDWSMIDPHRSPSYGDFINGQADNL